MPCIESNRVWKVAAKSRQSSRAVRENTENLPTSSKKCEIYICSAVPTLRAMYLLNAASKAIRCKEKKSSKLQYSAKCLGKEENMCNINWQAMVTCVRAANCPTHDVQF